LFLSLSKLGVAPDVESDVNRRVIFSNVVFASLPVVYLIFLVIDFRSYLVPVTELQFDQFVVPVIIGICILCLKLNQHGLVSLSRIIFLALWPFLLHIIPIVTLESPNDYTIAYPFGLVFHATLVQLMLSYKSEKWPFWLFLAVNFIAMLVASDTLLFFDRDGDLPVGLLNYIYFRYDVILYWLLFNLLIFYVLYVVDEFVHRMSESRKKIEQQKTMLDGFNRDLEKIVAQRTNKLEEQNETLRKHAFYNAHLLRGPFCRVKGLIELQQVTTHSDSPEIREKLVYSLQELDDRIKEIQKIIEEK